MKTDNLKALTISGPIEQLDEAIRRFVVDKPFHPEDACERLAAFRKLRHIEETDVYTPCLARVDALIEQLGLTPACAPSGDDTDNANAYSVEEIASYCRSVEDALRATDVVSEESRWARLAEERVIAHLKNVPVPLRDIADNRYVRKRFGILPETAWPEFLAMSDERPDQIAVEVEREHGEVFLFALCLHDGVDEMDANLSRLGFVRLKPPADLEPPDCTAAEVYTRLEEEKAEAARRAEETAAKRRDVIARAEPELMRRRSWLAYEAACARARRYIGQNYGKFYLFGWVPAEEADAVCAACRDMRFTCVAASPREVRNAEPPVRIRESGVRGILSPLMRMYGIPAYGTADPRVFMVITYTLFFGMMFGDAGQGACIAVLGFLLYRKTRSWLWRILSLCGLSAVVFGLIYGSVFGLEDLLPWGGYHPLEADHIMPVLLAGAAVGVVVILICMGFNIVNSLRRGDLRGAFFSANGVSGAVLYVAVLAAIACAFTGTANLLTPAYVWPLIVLPIALIWLGEPLGKLLAGDPNWQPESWGMYIVEGFFDIFESAISYMSNTMSFLRVGAFAISHAGMMMVVSMLSEGAAATGSVIIMIFGNIFVAGLEAALSSIQIIRLEFYEIFGRFYIGGGHEFTPVTADCTR